MRSPRLPLFLGLALALPALAAEPDARSLLAGYDAVMSADSFEAEAVMNAHRDDGTERSYTLKMLKSGADKNRVWFLEPASARGQEILRRGDNSWLYMPNLKRSIRMASRDSFQGGDFNNADVLRADYAADYDARIVPDGSQPDAWMLELTARGNHASYDRIRLWISRADRMPLKGEYFSASGKLLRTAEFLEVKELGGRKRPSKVVMRNMIATRRYSEMIWKRFDTSVKPAGTRFVLDDLGR